MSRRPDLVQLPSFWQISAVYRLVSLNHKLVAGQYGDLLPPDIALEFREAMALCERLFELPTSGNDNKSPYERDLDVLREVLKS